MTKIVPLASLLKGMTKSQKTDTLEEIGEFLVQSILDNVGSGKSPVEGGAYQKQLTKVRDKNGKLVDSEYSKLKSQVSGSKIANMELYGDMLDALEYRIDADSGTVEVGIFDEEQAAKAAGHHSGKTPWPGYNKSKLPVREFIPRKNKTFDQKSIMQEIYRIASSASED